MFAFGAAKPGENHADLVISRDFTDKKPMNKCWFKLSTYMDTSGVSMGFKPSTDGGMIYHGHLMGISWDRMR